MDTQLTVKNLQHQAWAGMIQKQIKSGLTIRSWCSRNGMNTKTFYYRRKQVRGDILDTVPAPELKPITFTELVPPSTASKQQAPKNSAFEAQLTIEINGSIISVNQDTPRQLLMDVMKAVSHA